MSAQATLPTVAIALEPSDWFLAPWRHLPPLSCPETPFVPEKALAQLEKVGGGNAERWDRAALAPGMSPAEARFWYEAITQSGPSAAPRAMAVRLRWGLDDRPLGRPEILSRLRRNQEHLPPHLVLPLARMLSPRAAVEIALSSDLENGPLPEVLRRGIQRFLIPWLPEPEMDELRELLRERLRESPPILPRRGRWMTSVVLLAAALGMHAEMDAIVSGWGDGYFARWSPSNPESLAQWVVFGLGSADAVRRHMHRVGLRLVETDHVRAWLANTELADLAFIRDSVLACTHKPGAERLLKGLTLVRVPELAPLLLELKLASKAPQAASEWLEENPARATAGLVGVAGGRGKLAEAAQQVLRDLSRGGFADIVETVLEEAGAAGRIRRAVVDETPPLSTVFDKDNIPEWLLVAAVEQLGGRPRPLPRWITPEHLPHLRIGEHHLNTMLIHAAVNALRDSTLERQAPLVRLLPERAEPSTRDAFAWALFERWLAAGAPSQDRWALLAVGLWGGDPSVVKLAPMVRNWPAEKQARRAMMGLECLRAIGTDTALLELSGIAQKVRFRKLQQTASGFILQIAGERRLSTAQLEDRIVPHLDLDARGSRIFDFGSRKFRLVLGQHFKPCLCDEDGKVRGDLPKPGANDDPVKAPQAVAEWKVFKKQIREVLKVQQARLESAMLSGRRWGVEEFETYLVRHSLMGLLAQGILWGALDEDKRLVKTFRVTEDRTLVDRHEALCDLAAVAGVFIVHPLHLSEEERRAWQEVFMDHEILAAFPQLTRRVHLLAPEETGLTVLRRYDGKKVPAVTLMGILDRTGWDRGRPEGSPGSGWGTERVMSYLRYFHAADLTAVLRFRDGIPAVGGYQLNLPDQVLGGCFFVPRLDEPASGFQTGEAVPLGTVDRVVLSEVIGVLEVLASKAS
jgi:hypothetical protein